jgi:purine-binding chemotaxis protein CheW
MEQFLVFRLGSETYGLEVTHIQEVVEASSLYYIPRAPAIFCGAVNFHGSILPVLDLAAVLGFDKAARDPRVVVLTPGVCRMALAVSAILGIVRFAEEDLLPFQEDSSRDGCIRAVFAERGEMINLLDLGQLLSLLENF